MRTPISAGSHSVGGVVEGLYDSHFVAVVITLIEGAILVVGERI